MYNSCIYVYFSYYLCTCLYSMCVYTTTWAHIYTILFILYNVCWTHIHILNVYIHNIHIQYILYIHICYTHLYILYRYGFQGEILHKYDNLVYKLFNEVFANLPLAAVIHNEVFVVHGGIRLVYSIYYLCTVCLYSVYDIRFLVYFTQTNIWTGYVYVFDSVVYAL